MKLMDLKHLPLSLDQAPFEALYPILCSYFRVLSPKRGTPCCISLRPVVDGRPLAPLTPSLFSLKRQGLFPSISQVWTRPVTYFAKEKAADVMVHQFQTSATEASYISSCSHTPLLLP